MSGAAGEGRPWAHGLAAAGEAGVRSVLENLVGDADLTLALTGCTSCEEVGPPRPVRRPA